MRSPREMNVIEIDITNACIHSCSNCTRFCGHHKKPFFMSFEDFKKAIDSLDDFNGMVGIIGGEPTLHPELEKFIDYVRERRVKKVRKIARGPISDMQTNIIATVDKAAANVLFLSSLSRGYYKYFEVINDTFARQLLNDHKNEVMHQALLMSRKELGISDEEWIEKRNACWIQNSWSATITPKGAFFCEVAGALDMLFDGPGGWKVEPGWIDRKPEDFTDQLHWCEMCSACLDVPKRLSSDEIDDITPGMAQKLQEIGSPKLSKGRCVIRDPNEFDKYKDATYVTGTEFMDVADNQRMSMDNKNLMPDHIDYEEGIIDGNNYTDWIAYGGVNDKNVFEKFVLGYIWNPGCLYIIDNNVYLFNANARAVRGKLDNIPNKDKIIEMYDEDKIIYVSSDDPYLCVLGGDTQNQYKHHNRKGKRLLIFGAGEVGRLAVKLLIKNKISDFDIAVSDTGKNEDEIFGNKVRALDEFIERKDGYVVLIAGKPFNHCEMTKVVSDKGFKNYRYMMQSEF